MDNHVRIAELQQGIREGIEIEESNILFEFKENTDNAVLEVITINAKHKQSFLFHSTEGRDKIEALESMLEYVNQAKTQYNSYTLQWSLMNEDKLHTSYFRAKNIMDALDKFYHKKDINSVNVFSVVLNPIA
jgi:hypothetical protein